MYMSIALDLSFFSCKLHCD